jgi:hypothetical protein
MDSTTLLTRVRIHDRGLEQPGLADVANPDHEEAAVIQTHGTRLEVDPRAI